MSSDYSVHRWKLACYAAAIHLTIYYVLLHPVLGIWLFNNRDAPYYALQPLFPENITGLFLTGVFIIFISGPALVCVISLNLGLKQDRVDYIILSLVFLFLLVFMDIAVVALQVFYWDLLMLLQLAFTMITMNISVLLYKYLQVITSRNLNLLKEDFK